MSLIPDRYVERQWNAAMARLAVGTLEFTSPDGKRSRYEGRAPGPNADFTIHSWDVLGRTLMRGDIGLGEEYVSGRWETSDLESLFQLFIANMDHFSAFAHGDVLHRIGFVVLDRLLRRNSLAGSARNIKAHYDVGNEFYRLWLDKTMTYSSALFGGRDVSLEDAQHNKYGRILERFDRDHASVLEVGCGWGGFAEDAAAKGHTVKGLTISPAQHAFARERLNGAADIQLQDYRDERGTYDMIVSIEMFEAVGERYWPAYFGTLARALRKGGRALIQTITIGDSYFEGYRSRSDFIRHYVFPGGLLPSLKRFREEAAQAGLKVMDTFAFGQDYAKTLRSWTARLKAAENDVRALGHDNAFLRNWHFYLAICAATFAVGRSNVVQVELAHA